MVAGSDGPDIAVKRGLEDRVSHGLYEQSVEWTPLYMFL